MTRSDRPRADLTEGQTMDYREAYDAADEKVSALTARVKALEGLLACYRAGTHPSETLFTKLDRSRKRLDELGVDVR